MPNLLSQQVSFKIFCTSFLLFCGCGKSFNSDAESAKGTVKVQIIAPSSIAAEPSGNALPYSFADVELQNIFDLTSVSGAYAHFFTHASRVDQKIIGAQPKGQFLKDKDGVFRPRNFLSLQLATIYYHTQNLFKLESSLKIENPRSAPLKIILDTPIINSKQTDNNAFYEGSLDAIIFLKYSEEDLPLSLNGGVFAHEYFHSIFERIVLKQLKSNDLFSIPASINKISEHRTLDVNDFDLKAMATNLDSRQAAEAPIILSKDDVKWYYALLLKGFNEGLADYWGWSYVNDVSFIGHSLKQTRVTRKLDLKSQAKNNLQLLSDREMLSIVFQTYDSKFETQNQKLELINAFSYLLGTRFALFFKTYSETIQEERKLSKDETKKIVNQLVIDFIKGLSKNLSDVKVASTDSDLVSPYSLVYKFIAEQTLPNEKECIFLKTFIENDAKISNTLNCTSSSGAFKLNSKSSGEKPTVKDPEKVETQ